MTLIDDAQKKSPELHNKIVAEYETLIRVHEVQAPILEIMHGQQQSAITMSGILAGKECHAIGRGKSTAVGGVSFHQGNPNDMSALFGDQCFSTVIWDRAIERDPFFWLTLAEIKRVLKPAGFLIVCAPGFGKTNKFGLKITGAKGNVVPALTATRALDTQAADFWRASPQCMRKVILNDFDVREVKMSFFIPHLFAVGQSRSQ